MKKEINAELILKTVASYEKILFSASVLSLLIGILATTAGDTISETYKINWFILTFMWLFSAVYNNYIRTLDKV